MGDRERAREDEGREGDRGNGGEEKRNKSWRCLSFEEWKTAAHNVSGGKNLLGEKYFFKPAVPDNRSLRRLLSTPLVQEDQTMDWSTQGWREALRLKSLQTFGTWPIAPTLLLETLE